MRPQSRPLDQRLIAGDPKIRDAAVAEIGYLSDASKEELAQSLVAILKGGGRPAAYAAEALGRLESSAAGAVPALVEAFQSGDFNTSSNAIWALGEIGAEAVPAIAPFLEHEDPEVRVITVLALEKIEEGAVPWLLKALKDEDAYVRLYAIGAIEEIGAPETLEAVPFLITLAQKDPESAVRERALEALEAFDTPMAREAARTLRQK